MGILFMLAGVLLFGAEYIIDVPEGQSVTNSTALNAETAGDILVKTGKGTWYKKDTVGATRNFSKMEIREGTVEIACGTSLFHPPLIEIKSGAILKQLNSVSYNNMGTVIQIDEGGTFNDFAKAYINGGCDIQGAGLYVNMHANLKVSSLPNFTGEVVTGLGTDTSINFGDGKDAANDPDISHMGSFTMVGGNNGSGNYPRLVFQNKAPTVVTNRIGGCGTLTIAAGSVVTLSNLWKTTGSTAGFSIQGTLTNVNGRVSQVSSTCFNMNNVDARYVQIGGVFYGTWPYDKLLSNLPYSRLYYPNGTQMSGTPGSGYGTRILENGAEFWTQYQQPFRTEVNSGSTLVFANGTLQSSNAKSGERLELKFDNGTLRQEQDFSQSFSITGPGSVRFVVGPRGMTIASHGQASGSPTFEFTEGVEFTDNGSNGPLRFRGNTTIKFFAPLDIGGTVTFENGTVTVPNKAAYYADGANPPFGTGSVVMNQGRIWSSLPSGKLTRLADAPGATLRLTGSATLHMNSNNTGINWQIGPTSATACSIVREKGAALFFDNSTSKQYDFFKNNKGTCVVGGGLPLGTNGKLPVVPVFVQDGTYTHSGDSWGGEVDFLTYGESGLVRFENENYATEFGTDPTVVAFISASTNLAADAAVAGLNVGKSSTVVGIPSGKTLTLGDGTGTACVILNQGSIKGVSKKGTGTLDFGAAEGVVTCCRRGGTISANIAGTGGLSVVGSYVSDVNGWGLDLGGDNTYSGGTRISSYRAYAKTNTAFGTGDVWALGGEGNGGQIGFNNGTTKVTLANNLHLSGNGQTQGNSVADRTGAIWARSSAELTGTVELVGPTRMTVAGEATELKFSNVISGDSIAFYNNTASIANAGTVVFTQANTYTGNTEVVRTTLVLEPGAQAGTGEMVLDGAELVLKMETPGVTMPNALRGAGTVKLDGPKNALVTFKAAPAGGLLFQQEHTLDLNGLNRAVNSLAGFTSVTNSGTKKVFLSVLEDAKGSFTGTVSDNVELYYGNIYCCGMVIFLR